MSTAICKVRPSQPYLFYLNFYPSKNGLSTDFDHKNRAGNNQLSVQQPPKHPVPIPAPIPNPANFTQFSHHLQPPTIPGSTSLAQIGIPPPPLLVSEATSSGGESGDEDEEEDEDDGIAGLSPGAKRAILPKRATSVLRAWLFQHLVVSIRVQFVISSVFN